LRNYEKRAFIQIFLGYFISVAIFILLLGFLYFEQQKVYVIQKTAMGMHEYLMKLKQADFEYTQENYSYEIINDGRVKKQLPQKKGDVYVKVFSKIIMVKADSEMIDEELNDIKIFTILLQIFFLLLFAFISFVLTRKSLKPMVDTISHLDRFTKDLIHDLNTPVTSILINTKMLKKNTTEQNMKKILRIENSAKNISSLYANLEVLLDENSIKKDEFNLSLVLNDLLETYKSIYPNISFNFANKEIYLTTNQNAVKRIIDNILSNACKYSSTNNPTITILFENNTLTIKDNGKGIKYPKKIFERSYKEDDNGHGIGMHIVHRLCNELSLNIDIESKENIGTIVTIKF